VSRLPDRRREELNTLSQETFLLVAGVIFLLVSIMHVLRLAFKWHVTLDGWTLPKWVSWIAIFISGFLAYAGLRLSGRH